MGKDHNILLTGIALFLGAFFFSLFFINEGLFHCDSVILAKAVEDTYRTGHLQPAVSGRYGAVIINAVLYLPFYLFGQNADLLTRLSSVFFYSMSIPAFFIFINDLFRNRVQGLLAAVLLALTPFYLIPNTYGKEHGMSMFFFLCAMVLVNRGGEEKRPAAIVLAGLSYMVSLSVRESALFMFPFYCWLYFKPVIAFRPFRIDIKKERLDGRLLISLILPFVVVFGFMVITYLGSLIQMSLNGDELSVPHYYGLVSKNLSWVFRDLGRSFPSFLFLFGALGAVMLWLDRRDFLFFFFLVWAGTIFVYGNFDSYVARYLGMSVLALHAFASYFLARLYRWFRVPVIFIFVLLGTWQLTHMYPLLEFRRHYDGTMRLGSFVKATTPPNAVFLTGDEGPFIEYYGKRKTIDYPIGHWERLDSILDKIKILLEQKVPVYIVPTAPDYLRGTILSDLIKAGVLTDISSTAVSFQLYNELRENVVRKVAKNDYDKIQAIFQQVRGQCGRKILDRFKVFKAGKVLVEDYHHPELDAALFVMPVYKLGLSGFARDEFTEDRAASGLLKAITRDSGISMPQGKDDMDKLNNILKMNGLYKKFPGLRLPRRTPCLIKPEAELTENELMRRNRFVLEAAYPQQCPKFYKIRQLNAFNGW